MADARSPLTPLLRTLGDLVNWLEAARVSGVVIGGVAVSLLGRPRATRDVDVLVEIDAPAWNDFLVSGATYGFSARRADAIQFAQAARVLLVRHEPSGIYVDIVLSALPFEQEAIARMAPIAVAGVRIPLPTPEDLIIMKAVAGRPRDIGDVEGLLAANPQLDLKRVRRWVREFATALARPQIYKTLEALLPTRRRKAIKGRRRKKRKPTR